MIKDMHWKSPNIGNINRSGWHSQARRRGQRGGKTVRQTKRWRDSHDPEWRELNILIELQSRIVLIVPTCLVCSGGSSTAAVTCTAPNVRKRRKLALILCWNNCSRHSWSQHNVLEKLTSSWWISNAGTQHQHLPRGISKLSFEQRSSGSDFCGYGMFVLPYLVKIWKLTCKQSPE